MGFNLDDYESVADRIDRFWTEHPTGTIITDLVHHDDKRFIVRASVWRKARDVVELNGAGAVGPFRDCLQPHATGYAEEIVGSTNVNKTSALENCETSAIGRALANLGYASKGQRASREEMAKTQPEPRQRSGGRKTTPTPPDNIYENVPSPADLTLAEAQARESHKTAPTTDLTPDVAAEVKRMKNWAFQQLSGDVEKTKTIWEQVLSTYNVIDGLPNADSLAFIESDLSIAVGEALTEELVNP